MKLIKTDDYPTDKRFFLTCQCHSNEHIASFDYLAPTLDEHYEPVEVFLSVHLYDHKKWYKRLWAGIKYIFGYRSVYGNWDEMTLGYKELIELRNFVDGTLQDHEKYVNVLIDAGIIKVNPELPVKK